jgi:hypothetical protein
MGNFKHKYKTITRFYNQNFWDFQKIKQVDLLLGQKRANKENETMNKEIGER